MPPDKYLIKTLSNMNNTVKGADLQTFIDRFQPSKFKKLSSSIEVRGVQDLEPQMEKARLCITDHNLNLVVVNDAQMASYKAFEVKEIENLKWVDFPSLPCPKCGIDSAEVHTKSKKINWIFDGEDARCKECGHTGYVNVEDSECADIIWDELEEKELANG